MTPEIPSEEVKPDASDETPVETERQPESTGNAETPEQSSEEVTTPENTPEKTPEEVDLSLSKKELKKLMKSKTFSIEKFSKRMYESRNFYPIRNVKIFKKGKFFRVTNGDGIIPDHADVKIYTASAVFEIRKYRCR